MQVTIISTDAAVSWCRQRGLRDHGGQPAQLRFATADFEIRLPIPIQATRAIALGYVLLMTFVKNDDEARFPGGLLWLTEWDIGSETSERLGHALLGAVRAAAGGSTPVAESPAHLIDAGRLVEAQVMLHIPMTFGWDALYVPALGGFFAYLSHEGWLTLHAPDARTQVALAERFRGWTVP